ncbi:MAG: sigma-70 family RNA polymerase sigma factor [Acidobacteriia bacterium]|nr:sigma-70 family RNA polymerase sigma factor [Terriglobia bacterium]
MTSPTSTTSDNDSDGGPGSSRELLPEVYDELRKLARARLSRERHEQTLQPTALVHEAYLRVAGDRQSAQWDRRGHFFAAAALAMRRILVERARHYQRLKHGAGGERVELDSAIAGADPGLTDLMAIDEALTRLEQTDARKAQVVSLRYFAGLSIEETAAALDVSPATVKNEWKFARAWLYRALGPAGGALPPDES